MSDFAPPRNSEFHHTTANLTAVSRKSDFAPFEIEEIVTVCFDSSGRWYTYWCPSDMPASVRFVEVVTPESGRQVVKIIGRGPPTTWHIRNGLKAISGYYVPNNTAPRTGPVKQEERIMGLKIEDKKFVNGKDFKEYSEDQLYSLLRQSQETIEALEKLPGNSKKVARQIAELKKAQEELVALIDGGENDEASEASTA